MIRTTRYGPYLVLVAAILWASDAPFRNFLVSELPSSLIIFVEHGINFLILLPVLYFVIKKLPKLSIRSWLAIVVIGIGGSALAALAFTQAFRFVNPSVAILLQKLQPLVAITLAGLVLKETLSPKFWLWAIIALGGAYIISFPNFLPQLYVGEVFNPNLVGLLWALAAVVLWAVSTVLGRYVLREIDFKSLTTLRFVIGFIFLFLFTSVQGDLPLLGTISSKAWLYLLITAVTSGVVSIFIYYRGLQDTKASVATLAELGFPLAAVAVNAIFIDAPLSIMQLVGMAILLIAVVGLSRVNSPEKEQVIKTQEVI